MHVYTSTTDPILFNFEQENAGTNLMTSSGNRGLTYDTAILARALFTEKLDDTQRMFLYNYYRDDFEMFGYDPNFGED